MTLSPLHSSRHTAPATRQLKTPVRFGLGGLLKKAALITCLSMPLLASTSSSGKEPNLYNVPYKRSQSPPFTTIPRNGHSPFGKIAQAVQRNHDSTENVAFACISSNYLFPLSSTDRHNLMGLYVYRMRRIDAELDLLIKDVKARINTDQESLGSALEEYYRPLQRDLDRLHTFAIRYHLSEYTRITKSKTYQAYLADFKRRYPQLVAPLEKDDATQVIDAMRRKIIQGEALPPPKPSNRLEDKLPAALLALNLPRHAYEEALKRSSRPGNTQRTPKNTRQTPAPKTPAAKPPSKRKSPTKELQRLNKKEAELKAKAKIVATRKLLVEAQMQVTRARIQFLQQKLENLEKHDTLLDGRGQIIDKKLTQVQKKKELAILNGEIDTEAKRLEALRKEASAF